MKICLFASHVFYFVVSFGILILRKKFVGGLSFNPKIPKKQKLKAKETLKMVPRLLKKQETVWRSQTVRTMTAWYPACPWA